MRLCSVIYQGRRRLAVDNGGEMLLPQEAPFSQTVCVFELLQMPSPLERLRGVPMQAVPASEVVIQAPVSRLHKNVICLGWNYMEHARESAGTRIEAKEPERPAHPIVFTKAPETVIGPFDSIPASADITTELDWEVELGVIIGRDTWKVPADQALDHVFGYTVINDISARDIQARHKQFFLGKSLPGACPMGPVVVTADEIGDPGDLRLCSRVNGVVKQEASTAQMVFDVPHIIAEISAVMPLRAGDIIATGTPAGVGFARKPPEFLRAGDRVECEVEKIGKLSNPVS